MLQMYHAVLRFSLNKGEQAHVSGPYYKGQLVLVHRRKRGDASNPGRRGVWLGPGEVVAVESTSDKLVPRVVYVTVHGRLFLCSPEQLRPISLKASWVRTKLQEAGVSGQQTFKEMKHARGIDVRNERPSSAELETEHDKPDEDLVLEQLGPEADYEPLPQAPPTPAPGTPGPHTPAPGTPVPGTPVPGAPRSAPLRPELVSTQAIPPTPPTTSANLDTRRGEKRSSEPHQDVEAESLHRAQQGPTPVVSQVPPTVTTGEASSRRVRSRTPPPREGSYLSFADFEGASSDHVHEGWYSESQDHEYSGLSLGLEFNVDIDEIQDESSVRYILQGMCLSAAAMKKRGAEVVEKYLNEEEKAMFRTAKHAEWSQWVGNEVVELISRKGIDPRRVISSRWVLTWKRVEDTPGAPKKPKARLVIRGFKGPGLGQFSTASPTLSRQGRHAVLTVAAQNMWRIFTLDAKTAFLAGDQSARVKPIYAELTSQGFDQRSGVRRRYHSSN